MKIKAGSDWPAGVRQPSPDELSDMFPEHGVGVYRIHRYEFDHDETECHGPLEFCVCYYSDFVSILFRGIVLDPEPKDAQGNPKPAGKLHKGQSEVCGVCWDWILEKGGSAAAGALKGVIPVSSARTFDQEGDTMMAMLGANSAAASTMSRLEPVFTRYAFDELNHALAQKSGRAPVDASRLESVRGGLIRISEVADELSSQRSKQANALADVLKRVASTGVRVSGSVVSDDAWIAAAHSEAASMSAAPSKG